MHRGNVQHPVVCEAIQPVFAGFVRLDDGMIPVVCVLSRVPARAGVTATNMAADSAAAQVNPPAFRLHAFHTAWTAGCSFLNEINVSAGFAHEPTWLFDDLPLERMAILACQFRQAWSPTPPTRRRLDRSIRRTITGRHQGCWTFADLRSRAEIPPSLNPSVQPQD